MPEDPKTICSLSNPPKECLARIDYEQRSNFSTGFIIGLILGAIIVGIVVVLLGG